MEPPAAPESPPTVANPAAAPRLTQLLSKEKQWEYNREIDNLLLAVNGILDKLEKRPLAEDEMDLLGRVRAFAQQTTETRKVDLVTARSLARRAELLARELEQSTR